MPNLSPKLFMPGLLLLLVILAGCGQIAGGSSGGSSTASTIVNTLTVTRTATIATPTAYDCEAKVPITIAEVERVTQMTLSPF